MEPTSSAALDDDVRSEAAMADPHGFFRRLRGHAPVHWSARSNAWIFTSHAAVSEGFKDPRLSSDRLGPLEAKMTPPHRAAMAETFALLRGWMVFRDPPVHERLRDPVRRAFTRSSTTRLTAMVETIVDELVTDMAARPDCELIADFAFPLPAIVIAEMLGVPREDRDMFKTWSRKLSGLVFGAVEQPNRDRAAGEAAGEFTEYFTALIRRYEAAPADNLISALIDARNEGSALTADQMVGACTMLLFGGHETTTGLIANGMTMLLTHRAEWARLRRDPALVPLAVEESLRFEGLAKIMVRHVIDDHTLGTAHLAAGDRVYLSVSGANRDPAVFPEPDRFDVGRDPNPHLAFGHGVHFCLGAALARLEAAAAFRALVQRFPNLHLTAEPEWLSTIIGRGVARVPLAL